MIVELGLFRIDATRVSGFEPVAADIRSAFERGGIPGLHSFHIASAVEDAGRWAVVVCWGSLEDHQRFVASAEGKRQRDLLAEFMIDDPDVLHLSLDDVTQGLL
jgi:heme-degrading monooxygenase HmoA